MQTAPTAMVISPHADDAAAFCGATLAKFADQGWHVIRPELRSTAMTLTEFVQGAVASVVIIPFGNFADRYGLTQTLLVLAAGFWVVALLVTIPYYFVYSPEADRLREAMQERREIIVAEGQ